MIETSLGSTEMSLKDALQAFIVAVVRAELRKQYEYWDMGTADRVAASIKDGTFSSDFTKGHAEPRYGYITTLKGGTYQWQPGGALAKPVRRRGAKNAILRKNHNNILGYRDQGKSQAWVAKKYGVGRSTLVVYLSARSIPWKKHAK